ncbi:hypothetical protein Tco_0690315 [Tanacetum coccineum]
MLLNHQDLKILTIQTKFTSYDQGSLWVASRFSPRSSGMKLWYYLLSNGFKRGKIDQIYDWVFDVSHHLDQISCLQNEAGSGQVQDVIWGCECSTRQLPSIRRDLYLDDAEGTDYLLTATIFEELARMGSSMASLIICLATNQKFNLSKYIFDAMVKHLYGGVKFLLYPRFLQVFINQQLGNMSTHKKIIVYPFHTKKFFANMKRAGKDFTRRITPLFDTMMVQPVEEMGEDSDHPTDSTPIHIIDQPSSSSQPKKDKPSTKAQRQEAEVPQDEAVRLERRKMSRPTGLKRLRKVGSSEAIDADVMFSLVDENSERQLDGLIGLISRVLEDYVDAVEVKLMDNRQINGVRSDGYYYGEAVTTASINDNPKIEGWLYRSQESSEFHKRLNLQSSKIKEEGIMFEPEFPLKRKYQIAFDEQLQVIFKAKLDAELLEEQKLVRKQEEEANMALIESWENTQAMIEADRLLAKRL